ncbi:MAG: hypothetical protein A3B38_00720 [Candidatus Levybacteria bacterium RIFCSPLOWO2_01_FULL_36_13]|nr:MAG: hypothetical protein A2684_01960 [Candidatus Levybacteria bacterium RIFCSPHIGHO2_01_FULL_36_15b]OGH35411.1 MAG: hypothetical protein A3B38_00720 [Candidatus Levybacteria bacterium RIFCSPLOWO2_01_FULL_36_13]
MPIEAYELTVHNPEKQKHVIVQPGEKRHIPSIDLGGYEKIYEVQCKEDDSLATVHTIYPMVITDNPRQFAIYDDNLTENLPMIIKKGEHLDINIRQRSDKEGRLIYFEGIIRLELR